MADYHVGDMVYIRGLGTLGVVEEMAIRSLPERDIFLYMIGTVKLQDVDDKGVVTQRQALFESDALELVDGGPVRTALEGYLKDRRTDS